MLLLRSLGRNRTFVTEVSELLRIDSRKPDLPIKADNTSEQINSAYKPKTLPCSLTKEYLRSELTKFIKPNQRSLKSLYDFFTEFTDLKKVGTKLNTIKKFISLSNHLKGFEKKKHCQISFESMDSRFYERFTAFLITDCHHVNNTVGKYIAALKTFLNWATESGYNKNLSYRKFKVHNEPADIIYLTEKELMTLYEFDFGNERMEKVRDVFCFGCFTSLRHGDIARVNKDTVRNDEIHIKAAKTRDDLRIPLNQYAKAILEKYDYKLPRISNQKSNEYLKEMGKLVGINDIVTLTTYSGAKEIQLKEPKYKFMTSHVARRTFVTLSLEKGMRPEIVMSITGHKDYSVFKRYIKITSKVKKIEMKKIWEGKSKVVKIGS